MSDTQPYDQATRFLEEDGRFSFDSYWSRSASEFDLKFHRSSGAHAIGESGESGELQIGVPDYKRKKLPKGSFLLLHDGKGNRLIARRSSEDKWNREFPVDPAEMFRLFGRQGKVKIDLGNDRKKIPPMTGEIDLERLSGEWANWPDALRRLTSLQAEQERRCTWLIEPDSAEDPANWDCTSTVKDKWGEYYADGDARGMLLHLGKTISIRWYSNDAERGHIYWSRRKSEVPIDVVRLRLARDGSIIGQTLSRNDYSDGLEIAWSLDSALNGKEDMVLEARSSSGDRIATLTLPGSLLANAARQISRLSDQSDAKRLDYTKRCTAPQPIIVT